MNTTDTGQGAEAAVADFLHADGYKIIERNWKTRYAEIDIVAQKDGTMYFVEVKFRQAATAGDGFDYITEKKMHHMIRAAEAWVSRSEWQGAYELLAAAVSGLSGSYAIDIRPLF